jgi:hypothetical protein
MDIDDVNDLVVKVFRFRIGAAPFTLLSHFVQWSADRTASTGRTSDSGVFLTISDRADSFPSEVD